MLVNLLNHDAIVKRLDRDVFLKKTVTLIHQRDDGRVEFVFNCKHGVTVCDAGSARNRNGPGVLMAEDGMKDAVMAELRRMANTCLWSWHGWQAAWRSEKSVRQWSVVNLISAVLALALDLSTAERALVLGLGILVLAAELMNTALEEVVDYVSKAKDPRAKKAKDCGSAAVALTAIAAGVAWLVILLG